MPITVTNQQLIDSRDSLRKLSDMQIPVRTALKLRKIYKTVASEMESVQEMTAELARRCSKKDEKGEPVHPVIKKGEDGKPDIVDENRVEIDDTMREEFVKKTEELMEATVTIPFETVRAEDLAEPGDTLKVQTSLVASLDWLLAD